MLAQRIAALAVSPRVSTFRGTVTPFGDRTARELRAVVAQRRLQILGAIVGGTLAGFFVAAVVRRARQGCALRQSGANRTEVEATMSAQQTSASERPEVGAEPASTDAAGKAPTATQAAVELPEEPAYAFEPEAIVDLPDGLRPPVTPRVVPVHEGAEPELAGVR